MTASEHAQIDVSGYLVAGGVNNRLKVPPAVDLGEGGTRVAVKLSRKQVKLVLRDLRRGCRPKLRLTVSAVDPAGNTSTPSHIRVGLRAR